MKKTNVIFTALVLALLAVLAYGSHYELRLVPNKPELRPRPVQPSPLELSSKFELSGGSERDERGFPQRKIVDLSMMYPSLFFREGNKNVKSIALTFDDGPDSQYTPQILDILKEYDVKATFFLIGNRVELFPEVTQRIVDEGHIAANHSMTHANIAKLDFCKAKEEIMQGEEALAKVIGYRTSLFRSPYGSMTAEQVKEIGNLGYHVISWNVDSLDWKSLTAEQVKYNILENVQAGSIILQHSSGSKEENLTGTLGALPEIIRILKSEGYCFVTIAEMLNLPYKKQE